MVIIKYLNKEISKIDTDDVKAELISYEVSKEDMDILAKMQNNNQEYEIRRFILYKEWNSFELLVDNIENGRIIQGGLIDNKYILNQYLVEKGLNKLLLMLSVN